MRVQPERGRDDTANEGIGIGRGGSLRGRAVSIVRLSEEMKPSLGLDTST